MNKTPMIKRYAFYIEREKQGIQRLQKHDEDEFCNCTSTAMNDIYATQSPLHTSTKHDAVHLCINSNLRNNPCDYYSLPVNALNHLDSHIVLCDDKHDNGNDYRMGVSSSSTAKHSSPSSSSLGINKPLRRYSRRNDIIKSGMIVILLYMFASVSVLALQVQRYSSNSIPMITTNVITTTPLELCNRHREICSHRYSAVFSLNVPTTLATGSEKFMSNRRGIGKSNSSSRLAAAASSNNSRQSNQQRSRKVFSRPATTASNQSSNSTSNRNNVKNNNNNHPLLITLQQHKLRVQKCIQPPQQNYGEALVIIRDMLKSLHNHERSITDQTNNSKKNSSMRHLHRAASQIIDQTMRHVSDRAFVLPVHGSSGRTSPWERIRIGLDILDLQCGGNGGIVSSGFKNSNFTASLMVDGGSLMKETILAAPYNSVPKAVWLNALRALNALMIKGQVGTIDNGLTRSNAPGTFGDNTVTKGVGSKGYKKTELESSNTESAHNEDNSYNDDFSASDQYQQANASFRILQRLVTGIGIRYAKRHYQSIHDNSIYTDDSDIKKINDDEEEWSEKGDFKYKLEMTLDERDFCMALNGFANTGQMNMAHRVVALQERTEHAPPLSPVTYSILIKGHGRLGDIDSVDRALNHANLNGVEPDIIMFNSLIDAYVNCNDVDKAFRTFQSITNDVQYNKKSKKPRLSSGRCSAVLPNVRTYNIMLKGFAKAGDLNEAMKLSKRMQSSGIWDAVTTNTLVSVAVAANEFQAAESILTNRTTTTAVINQNNRRNRKNQEHPNIEAYTELLDGYAKSGMLGKALSTLQLMRKRGVVPNRITYTCMIGALARAKKISQAKKMLQFMEVSDGIQPGVVTYNAFLTGMLEKGPNDGGDKEQRYRYDDNPNVDGDDMEIVLAFHNRVDEAMEVLKQMITSGIRPNVVTTATIVDALGRCKPPRIEEARRFVRGLEESGVVRSSDPRVATSLIRACANAEDIDGASAAFKNIQKLDSIALNSYLDCCCRCGKMKLALDVLKECTSIDISTKKTKNSSAISKSDEKKSDKAFVLAPDVITFSILISALLKIGNSSAADRARLLYKDMKFSWGIIPDNGLVDIILTAMVRGGGTLGLDDKDIRFTLAVLRDARKLDWLPGQLAKRERAVKSVFMGRISEVWKEDEFGYGMMDGTRDEEEDPLFKKKNWNKIDSGFRLWGGSSNGKNTILKKPKMMSSSRSGAANLGPDEFLESKNWNDMDSGFRIL